jgi:heterodisulfide reductase subunit B
MKNDEEKRETINRFMDEEIDYFGEVEVVHFLTFLEQTVGWERLREKVKSPLKNLALAPYYGCTLQRPREVGIEPPGRFRLMTGFLEALGATVVDFSAADQCCGSYQIIGNPEAAEEAVYNILECATESKADAIAVSCPLCEFNLGNKQGVLVEGKRIEKEIPVFYFTQLLALALNLGSDACGFELNQASGIELLKAKGYPVEIEKAAA